MIEQFISFQLRIHKSDVEGDWGLEVFLVVIQNVVCGLSGIVLLLLSLKV